MSESDTSKRVTGRERYLRALKFQSVDGVPMTEWPIREATLNRWKEDGLVGTPEEAARLDPPEEGVPILGETHPLFDEQVLDETEDYKVWIATTGAVRKDHKNLATPGFVTRSWLESSLKTRADLPRFRAKFDSSTPSRYPSDWPQQVEKLRSSRVPVLWDTLRPVQDREAMDGIRGGLHRFL